jgi:hypothetical protein
MADVVLHLSLNKRGSKKMSECDLEVAEYAIANKTVVEDSGIHYKGYVAKITKDNIEFFRKNKEDYKFVENIFDTYKY